MNRRSPQPPRSLNAEERALAQALPRLHGRSDPGPDLDASILAAASAALQPARPTRKPARPQVGWIAPLSLAASLLLAVGLVWRLRPLPAPGPDITQPAAQADSANIDDTQAVRMIEPPAPPQTFPMQQSSGLEQAKPAASATTPLARQHTTLPVDASAASARESVLTPQPMQAPASAATPPPAPTSLPYAAAFGVNASDSQARERAANTGVAKPATEKTLESLSRDAAPATAGTPRMADAARPTQPAPARPMPAAPVVVDEAEMAADAGFVDDPDDSVPPATVDSPAVRDAWLQRIRQLLDQGNVMDAKASLAEFRRRYPDAALPAALQALESKP